MTGPDPPTIDAALRLNVAIDQLVQPGHATLDRSPKLIAQAQDEADTAHLHHVRVIRWKLTQTRDDHGRDRLLCALREAGRRQREHRTALTALHAVLPSLLDQLYDAVESTGGTGDRARGANRSPLNTAAAELLHTIRATTGHRAHSALADHLRAWTPADPEAGAADAQRWVDEARQIVEPARYTEARAPCPVCHTRRVTVTEDGQRVVKAAIQINLTRGIATCIAPGCTGRWDRSHFIFLAGVLEQDRDERAARKAVDG